MGQEIHTGIVCGRSDECVRSKDTGKVSRAVSRGAQYFPFPPKVNFRPQYSCGEIQCFVYVTFFSSLLPLATDFSTLWVVVLRNF